MPIITARWNGKCAECSLPTPAGSTIDYIDGRAYHVECSPPEATLIDVTADNERLAEELGFKRYMWDQLKPVELSHSVDAEFEIGD